MLRRVAITLSIGMRGRIAAPALCLILTGCVGLLCTARF